MTESEPNPNPYARSEKLSDLLSMAESEHDAGRRGSGGPEAPREGPPAGRGFAGGTSRRRRSCREKAGEIGFGSEMKASKFQILTNHMRTSDKVEIQFPHLQTITLLTLSIRYLF